MAFLYTDTTLLASFPKISDLNKLHWLSSISQFLSVSFSLFSDEILCESTVHCLKSAILLTIVDSNLDCLLVQVSYLLLQPSFLFAQSKIVATSHAFWPNAHLRSTICIYPCCLNPPFWSVKHVEATTKTVVSPTNQQSLPRRTHSRSVGNKARPAWVWDAHPKIL